jgi:hypothetical protein
MEMRGEHSVNLLRANPETLQAMQKTFRFAELDLLCPLLAELRADACLADYDSAVDARDDPDARALDHVVGVRGLLLFPQNLGHYAEHQAAIGLPAAGNE